MTKKLSAMSEIILPLLILTALAIVLALSMLTVSADEVDMSEFVTNVYEADNIMHTVYGLSSMPAGSINPNVALETRNKSLLDTLDNPLLKGGIVDNWDISLNFLYNDVYHEKILKWGETLTVEVAANNFSTANKDIILFAAGYQDGKLVSIICNEATITNNGKYHFFSVNLPLPLSNTAGYEVKAFVWDKTTLQPYINPVSVTETGTQGDYYESTTGKANFINYTKKISGRMNATTSSNDVDVVRFSPTVTGDYFIAINSTQALNGALRSSTQSVLSQNTIDVSQGVTYLQCNLSAGNTYSIFISGSVNVVADYTVNIYQAVSKGIVYENAKTDGTITSDADFFVYNFVPSISGTYILTTVGNTEVRGILFKNGSSTPSILGSTRDGTVSFRITQDMIVGSGTWRIAITAKSSGVTGLYSLYGEKLLTVTIN